MTTTIPPPTRQTVAPAGRWTVDPSHSSVEFAVKHLVIATIKGRFRDFEGDLEVQQTTGDIRGHGVVKVESIDTSEPRRDSHLRSSDFFDVELFPDIAFTLRSAEPLEQNRHRLHGEITIRGARRNLTLEGAVSDTARGPWGYDRIAIDLTGRLNRKDFGLRWNQVVEAGPVAGDEVLLSLSLSLVRENE
jgi:polyisoprenoid-binding protein YceI